MVKNHARKTEARLHQQAVGGTYTASLRAVSRPAHEPNATPYAPLVEQDTLGSSIHYRQGTLEVTIDPNGDGAWLNWPAPISGIHPDMQVYSDDAWDAELARFVAIGLADNDLARSVLAGLRQHAAACWDDPARDLDDPDWLNQFNSDPVDPATQTDEDVLRQYAERDGFFSDGCWIDWNLGDWLTEQGLNSGDDTHPAGIISACSGDQFSMFVPTSSLDPEQVIVEACCVHGNRLARLAELAGGDTFDQARRVPHDPDPVLSRRHDMQRAATAEALRVGAREGFALYMPTTGHRETVPAMEVPSEQVLILADQFVSSEDTPVSLEQVLGSAWAAQFNTPTMRSHRFEGAVLYPLRLPDGTAPVSWEQAPLDMVLWFDCDELLRVACDVVSVRRCERRRVRFASAQWRRDHGLDGVLPCFEVGQRFLLDGDPGMWTVQAVNPGRQFVVATRGEGCEHVILDMESGMSGVDNRGDLSYATREDCERIARSLQGDVDGWGGWLWGMESVEIEDLAMSDRGRRRIRFDETQPDGRTARMLPELWALLEATA